jgi:AAHS family 4-hydroxybenzoate transporter-like MFS transporter
MLADGYDTGSLSYAAPAFAKEWGISKAVIGGIFSVQFFGAMLGAFAFGFIADRFGRKPALCLGTALFGIFSLLTAAVADSTQLYFVRFFVGLAMGGAIPCAVSLSNEYSPRRFRVAVVALIFAAFTVGLSGGGLVAALLLPHFGWPIVFYVGGIVPIAFVIPLVVLLPESIQFLALRKDRSASTQAIVSKMRPDLKFDGSTQLLLESDQEDGASTNLRELFAGPRALMTPLLWLVYVANSTVTYVLVSWLPTLMEATGLPPTDSALAGSLLAIGGAAGGLVAAWGVDRFGLLAFCLLPGLGCPLIGSLGYLAFGGEGLLMCMVFASGFCVFGAQNCLHGVSASIYPTAIRANGVGWALGISRIGSMVGPFIGGLLFAQQLPVTMLFLSAAVPLLLAFAASLLLMGLYNRYVHQVNGSVPQLVAQFEDSIV